MLDESDFVSGSKLMEMAEAKAKEEEVLDESDVMSCSQLKEVTEAKAKAKAKSKK